MTRRTKKGAPKLATAIYKRVSSSKQDTASQSQDLDAFRKQLEAKGEAVLEFQDKFTGKSMNRPGWEKLWSGVLAGKIDRIVVWRIDRLGRTVPGLSQLFEDLLVRKVDLVSLKDCLSLSTAAGRLMAHVLASVAAYETEVRFERQRAGIAAAQMAIREGRREKYGSGRKEGESWKVNGELAETIQDLHKIGKPIAEIARVTKVSRPTVYKVLRSHRRAVPA